MDWVEQQPPRDIDSLALLYQLYGYLLIPTAVYADPLQCPTQPKRLTNA